MPVVTLPDGAQRRYDGTVTVAEVAQSIGAGLARAALAGKVNGRLVDTSFAIADDAAVSIVTDRDPEGLEIIRHSTAHLLAQAVKQLYPEAQVTIGPVIEDGFYYDFAYSRPFTTEDLAAIEARMRELAQADLPVSRRVMARDAAVEYFRGIGEKYKAEIIAGIPAGEPISLYGQGDWVDLCRGPHVPIDRQAQGLQAHESRGRLLARRFAQRDAAADLRHGLARREAARRPTCTGSRKPRSAITGASAASSTCSTCRKKRPARCSGIRRAGASSRP